MKQKILNHVGIMVALSVVLTFIAAIAVMYGKTNEYMIQDVRNEAEYIRFSVEHTGIEELNNKIKEMTNEKVYIYLAPPDLWNRHKETGKSTADIFAEGGIYLYKTNNDRIQGWLQMKEWLKVFKDEQGCDTARLKIFSTCKNLIRCLPQLQHDEKKVGDVATEPHEITHAPDAIRGFCVYWTQEPILVPQKQELPFELRVEESHEDVWW